MNQFPTTLTRGGPKLIIPPNYSFAYSAYSDSREKIIISLHMLIFGVIKLAAINLILNMEIEWKPSSQISFVFEPEYSFNYTSVPMG